MNLMFVSTGLDRLFLRSTARKAKGGATMSKASKSRSGDEPSASHPAVVSPSAVSLKNNKVGILTVDVAVYGDLCSASVDTVCTPTVTDSGTSRKANTAAKTGPLTWSGKKFSSEGESRKAFQMLHATAESNDEENDTIQGSVDGDGLGSDDVLGEQLKQAFPEHFVLPSEGIASVDTQDEYGTVGRSLVLMRNFQQLQPRSQSQLPSSSNETDVEMGLLGVSGSNAKEDAQARPAETTSA